MYRVRTPLFFRRERILEFRLVIGHTSRFLEIAGAASEFIQLPEGWGATRLR
jgi:hypothetical protein